MFLPDDVVARRANESDLGVVERSEADVDSHEPYPERSEGASIIKHPEIKIVAFRKFLKDGIPPRGSVLVRWVGQPAAQLIPENQVKLLDRSLLIGDVIKRSARDAMSGVVINTSTMCTLQPMCDVTYRSEHKMKGLIPLRPLDGYISIHDADKPSALVDIPAHELMYVESPTEEDLVIYKNWIGRLDAGTFNIAIRLIDGCIVEIGDDLAHHVDGAADAFDVGDIALTKKGHLRNGKWISGQYNPKIPPVGTVMQTRLLAADISWLQRQIGSENEDEPSSMLERDELESTHFHVYDRTRRPARQIGTPTDGPETVSNSEIDVRLGLRVRFKDTSGACVKYDGSTYHGKLSQLDCKDTPGYDINVFDIVKFHTDVIVQWQDLTITREKSIDLIPDAAIDDDHAAWPGEIAHTLDIGLVPGMDSVKQPGKVGVIQRVKADERMALIKWSPDACLQFLEEENGFRSVLTGAIGLATGPTEEISLYDVEAVAAMNVRRGDIVLISSTELQAQSPPGLGWLGEIVDTCLDGTLVIRLGAVSEVRDVKLKREDCVVAVRSDGTGVLDVDWDSGVAMGDGSGNLNAWHAQAGEGSSDDYEADAKPEDEDDEEEEEEEEEPARYEDENGEPLDEADVEDDDWESDDSKADEEMPDASQETPPTSHSATPPNTYQADPKSVATTDRQSSLGWLEPESYLILEGPVPGSHPFANQPSTNSPAHVKRLQKEHKILRSSGNLPSGVYVRGWESRLDLFRTLFIGPEGTPYQKSPFVFDFYLPPQFPSEPPQAYFHSWTGESGLGGVGRVNPNLYEDGKICLSLLGTWEGSKGEGWSASRSTLLQVIVSILGLVLVKEPYFNEAGYEPLAGLESSRRPSALYNERAFLRARSFTITALSRLRALETNTANGTDDLGDVIKGLYWAAGGPKLLGKVVEDVEEVLSRSEAVDAEPDGLTVMSRGACIPLRRLLDRLKQLH